MGQIIGAPAVVLSVAKRDRRKHQRVAVSNSARVRPLDHRYNEEIRTALNVSRYSIYFTTWADHYAVGMSLGVTFPYASVALGNSEYKGKVVRIDRLRDGRLGIAVTAELFFEYPGRRTAEQ